MRLNCFKYPRDSKYNWVIEKDGDFYKSVTKKKKTSTKKLLKLVRGDRLKREDKYKCCLVWFVHTILLAQNGLKSIEVEFIKMANSIKFFEEYP